MENVKSAESFVWSAKWNTFGANESGKEVIEIAVEISMREELEFL